MQLKWGRAKDQALIIFVSHRKIHPESKLSWIEAKLEIPKINDRIQYIHLNEDSLMLDSQRSKSRTFYDPARSTQSGGKSKFLKTAYRQAMQTTHKQRLRELSIESSEQFVTILFLDQVKVSEWLEAKGLSKRQQELWDKESGKYILTQIDWKSLIIFCHKSG